MDKSRSYAQAHSDLKILVSDAIDAAPVLGAPGQAASNAEVIISPWRIVQPVADRRTEGVITSATALFCVSIGPSLADYGCAAYDDLFHAAIASAEFALASIDPPESYWAKPPAMFLTLERTIERVPRSHRPKPVEHPLVVSILTAQAGRFDEKQHK